MKPNEFFKKRFGIIEESKNDEELMSNLLGCIAEDCGGCPYKTDACKTGLLMDVNNLIERQQAEIERLTAIVETAIESTELSADFFGKKAVREFAEKLKRKSELVAPSAWATPYRAVAVADIDKLMEGMGCNDEL